MRPLITYIIFFSVITAVICYYSRSVATNLSNRFHTRTISNMKLGRTFINMASTGRGGGSTKIKTNVDTSTKTNIKDEIEKDWRLILHDDTVHTIQQVCEILGAVGGIEILSPNTTILEINAIFISRIAHYALGRGLTKLLWKRT